MNTISRIMNKRNWQVFGPSKKTRFTILVIVVIILLVIVAWLLVSNDSPTAAVINEPSNQLTGATVQEQQQEQEAQQQTEQQEQVVEETPEEQERRQYYTYQGQCAFDLKQRQDDVAETTNVVTTYQQEIDTLNAEYERKKKELEEQYVVPLEILKPKLEKAQVEADAAKEKYDKLQTSCNLQQPQ